MMMDNGTHSNKHCVYEPVGNRSLPWLISQKLTERIINSRFKEKKGQMNIITDFICLR